MEENVDAEFAQLREDELQEQQWDTVESVIGREMYVWPANVMLHPLLYRATVERRRQVSQGATPEHDDQHAVGELANAASCYAMTPTRRAGLYGFATVPIAWPWDAESWQPCPGDRKRELVKAVSLLLAEWDRLDRLEAQA